jgi:hypothetical protein
MLQLLLGLLALLTLACTAPRSVLLSPEALPKGHVQAGGNFDVNLPTQTATALYGGLESGVKSAYDRATSGTPAPIAADTLNDFAKAMIAYALDPIGPQAGFFIRYGFWPRFDVGYHRDGGVNAFNLRWQFMGPASTDSIAASAAWRGSLAIQYSQQSYEMPSVAGLDKLQKILQFEFKRKDLLIPVIFGKPFGKQGRFGNFGIGAAYNLSFIEYGSEILNLVERVSPGVTKPFDPIQGKKTVSAYGGFTNIHLGYRWFYLIGSLACYWQDYGEFKLFGGESVALSGMTFVPAVGLELQF